jgi:RND family efflux transporter MFP subunit
MKSIIGVALLASAATLLTGCEKEQAPVAKVKNVSTVVAAASPVSQTNSITGEIAARVQSDLSFRVSGRITERLVDVGQAVKAGQVLARIEPEEQKADLDVAKANLEAAQAQSTQAELAYARQQNLFKTQVTTRAAVDQAQESMLTAQGNVKSAQAQLETAQDALSYTELRADSDGIITARNAEVGQVAQAASQVFTLAHDGPRDAVFPVYESLFLGQKLDKHVDVSLISDEAKATSGMVREISPTIDPATGTIRVKVDVGSADGLQLGSAVVGSFRSASSNAIELPWSAMASTSGKTAVWVVDPTNSTASIRPIEVATYGTGKFSVRSGVSPGDIVISEGTKFLRPGQPVTYDKEASK